MCVIASFLPQQMDNLVKTQKISDDSDDSDDDSDVNDGSNPKKPLMFFSVLKHLGSVNRIRVSIFSSVS